MKLTGIIEHSLGGFITIRGYAKLVDLAKASKAEEFQRKLIPSHKEEIRLFFERQRALFFPEVVLAYTLKYDYDTGESGVNPLYDIINKNEFMSNIDEIKFKPLQTEVGKQRVVDINIDDKWLENNQPFSRIDGNHRISAFLEENEHNPLEEFIAPFCLLLFEDTATSQDNKKLIFHNINSKARRLTSEEELKGIISTAGFFDEDLELHFGISYLQTRRLGELYPDEHVENILGNLIIPLKNQENELFKNSVFFELIEFLKKNNLINDKSNVQIIHDALNIVNNEFYNLNILKKSRNSAFLISAVGIQLHPSIKLKPYLKWLSKNHMGELTEVKAQSLYSIYLKLNEQSPKIFVAMPFNEQRLADFQNAYDKAINNINELDSNIKIKLFKIMSHQGESIDIVPKMINQIDECTIFIADVSEANPNVAYELGLAKGKTKSLIFVQNVDDKSKVPFDYTQTSRHVYSSFNDLTNKITENIKIILENQGYNFN